MVPAGKVMVLEPHVAAHFKDSDPDVAPLSCRLVPTIRPSVMRTIPDEREICNGTSMKAPLSL